jgi:hypothetical protein
MVFLLSCDVYILIKELCLLGFFMIMMPSQTVGPFATFLVSLENPCQKWCAQWLFCNFQTNKSKGFEFKNDFHH